MTKVLLSAFAVSFCATTYAQGWSKTFQQSYMRSCVTNVKASASSNNVNLNDATAKSFCTCTLTKLIQRYPTMTLVTPRDVSTIQEECKGELQKPSRRIKARYYSQDKQNYYSSKNRWLLR